MNSASLSQDGQQLVWRLRADQPFGPQALARDGRSLCLILEQARSSRRPVTVHLCLAAPRDRSHRPRLMLVSGPAAGETHPITASITRPGRSELTVAFVATDAGLAYRDLRWQVVSSATRGCPQADPAATSTCQVLYPLAPALARVHTPRLVGCVARGPDWVFQGPGTTHEVALTFDDGPAGDPPTADFVALLAREHVPATFFEVGSQISLHDPHGAIERRMLADGDMIGDHTWSHPDMPGLAPSAQRQQLAQTAAAIERASGFAPCLFRAPYGSVNRRLLTLARSMGLSTIQWDVDPRDWALPGVSAIASNVIDHAHNGAIIIQHFGGGPRYETLRALPLEIAALRARGYRFVTVTQMLGYRLLYR
ncbi:MAG TPA: polysaccharide deacetylase family protein [Solirubrobacteraceae bacterium]|nr:polysaccharide deacetylase family protein [Solirubrobacteraceae bacterium]